MQTLHVLADTTRQPWRNTWRTKTAAWWTFKSKEWRAQAKEHSASAPPPPGMHWKGSDLRGSQAGGCRRLPKRLGRLLSVTGSRA